MKSEISKSNLIILSKNSNDEITGYKLSLDDLKVDDLTKSQIGIKNDQLRRLSRVCDNLRRSIESLEHIENLLHENGSTFGFSPIPHALFCHATILYGACFVNGEGGRPLREIYTEISTHEIHLEILKIRHKRFGHIDENHDVRSDNLLWQVRVQDGLLIPETSTMRGDFLALPSSYSLNLFKVWIRDLLGRIYDLKVSIRSEICTLIGPIYITE